MPRDKGESGKKVASNGNESGSAKSVRVDADPYGGYQGCLLLRDTA